MDESQIVSQLKQNVPAEPVVDVPEPETPDRDPEAFHNNNPLDTMTLRYELMDYFELSTSSRRDPDLRSQLDSIINWAAETADSKDLGAILKVIRQHESSLGSRYKLTGRINSLFRYTRLASQKNVIEEKMKGMYGYS